MWLVSDECTRVGRETKRLWNSCQARVLQNGLLTAFSIPLHHSSWTLPLISSPALPIPFLCLLSPPPPQLSLLQKRMHKALVEYFKQRSLYSRAELDHCQALSQETDQKIRGTQVFVHIHVKQAPGKLHKVSPLISTAKKKYIPLFNFYLPAGGIPLNGGIFSSYHNNSVLCLALSEPHPASRLPCAACAKKGQPGKHTPSLCAWPLRRS